MVGLKIVKTSNYIPRQYFWLYGNKMWLELYQGKFFSRIEHIQVLAKNYIQGWMNSVNTDLV